jgi:cation diffusion facilitator family transporter
MNENSVMTLDNLQAEAMSLDELEANLSNELEEQLSGLEFLEKEREKIGNPEGLGATIENAVWEQFRLQIGSIAGEDFIKSNNDLTLDLSNKAHTQNIEDFKKGIFNLRNSETYKKRYEDYKANFVLDEQGQIKYFSEGRQKGKPIFKRERRVELFDKGRTKGKDGNDMDHSVPGSKMIRDAEAYANLPQEEIVKFANSDQNLNEIPSSLNRAKNDRSLKELIASYEEKGINISEKTGLKKEEIQRLIDEEDKAEKEYKILKETGKKKTVRKSQLREAGRIGVKALRAVVLGLLADFLKVVIKKLVSWFRSAERKFSTFIEQFKEAWKEFWGNLKSHLMNAGKVLVSTIVTAIFGPIVSVFTKLWTVLKTGYSSLLQAISYIRNPENRTKPFSVLMLEAGKIIVAGLSGIGALVLGEVIEKGLISAGLVIQIPLLGSLASIIGLFVGAIVSGIVGALVLHWIDKLIANKLKNENGKQQIEKQNEILATQEKLISVVEAKVENTKETVAKSIIERHNLAAAIVQEKMNHIRQNSISIANAKNDISTIRVKNNIQITRTENDNDLDKLFEDLNKL